ncbi:hypothetical protein AB1Y20_013284 [Prymnesium parvum]|uniref:Protein kinase domain-containing protein n=1 Tax=Prymnesium parvum TaxID=97485 RepID=A0AB34IL67_PRYPA|mmetsp:Transcript_14432/g.34307  ORF Transcript_14432/g.34307 Transcript_14432/m.34307 type:complete len:355 (+) Transcript_14432:130-1194(+)
MALKVGKFELEDSKLGAGGYGVVVMAKDTETGEKVAAKMIDKRKMKLAAIEKEIILMKMMSHPYVIGLRGDLEMDCNIFIFMELANKGELFGRVIQTGSLSEPVARLYFIQLMEAVNYMHSKGIAHRDLKLENVLLASGPKGDDICKVCDFGLAHRYEIDGKNKILNNKLLMETCGSKSYAAPEVLEGRGYDGFEADVWSCGICLFAMLAGFFPLDEATGADWRFERVKLAIHNRLSPTRTIFGFYERRCELSRAAVDLIDGMLTITPARRLKDRDVLDSGWMVDEKLCSTDYLDDEFMYDEAPRYRGGGRGAPGDYDDGCAPAYRGVPGAAPPMLSKQNAMFCVDFHLDSVKP